MSRNDLTDRQKDLDRAIERCGIKLDESKAGLARVMKAISANEIEASFVKRRITLRLQTQVVLDRADDVISKMEAMLNQFEIDDEEYRKKGRSLGIAF